MVRSAFSSGSLTADHAHSVCVFGRDGLAADAAGHRMDIDQRLYGHSLQGKGSGGRHSILAADGFAEAAGAAAPGSDIHGAEAAGLFGQLQSFPGAECDTGPAAIALIGELGQ